MPSDPETIFLFTDGSVDPKSKIGYGAYLAINDLQQSTDSLKKKVQTKAFSDTSSTRLELETLLWALDDLPKTIATITLYTDSQNIQGLPNRRERLESNDFLSRTGKPIKNADLYLKFYDAIDSLKLGIMKVQGHSPTRQKSDIDALFTLVDRASRKALKASRA